MRSYNVRSGADIDAQNGEGKTPLHIASWRGRLAIVQALLSGGANILAANNQRELPSHYALSKGKSEVAKCLL
jgi:ankyrin repeat protein